MIYNTVKRIVIFILLLILSSNYYTSNADNIPNNDLKQINIDKVKISSGIDYILLPNGEKVYSDSTSYTVYENGTYIFSVYDRAGNVETVEVEISNIDTTLPTLNLEQIEEDGCVQIDVSAIDNESGISHIILPDGKRVDENHARFRILKNGEYTFQVYDIAGNVTEKTLNVSDLRVVEILIEKAEFTKSMHDISVARDAVNALPEIPEKKLFQDRLNNITDIADFEPLERLNSSSNLDLYVKSENALTVSLSTNSVIFEDFSGAEDMEKTNAIEITINSSLAYDINAYLPTEIQNSDKSNTISRDIFHIKENYQSDYQTFNSINDKVTLIQNCIPGNNLKHGIDIKLKGGISHQKDVYKTTIKIEVVQK